MIILAVKDRAMDAFMPPFCVPAMGMGVRAFRDEVNKEGTALFQHPDDYDLYKIGEFEDATGRLREVTADGPELLIRGKDCKETK